MKKSAEKNKQTNYIEIARPKNTKTFEITRPKIIRDQELCANSEWSGVGKGKKENAKPIF